MRARGCAMKTLPIIILGLISVHPLCAVPVPVAVVVGNEAVAARDAWVPVMEFVSAASGHDLQLRLSHDHDVVESRIRTGATVVAVVDGLHMEKLRDANIARPIAEVKRSDGEGVRTRVFVRPDSVIRELSDLDGHTLALLPPGIHCAANALPSAMIMKLLPEMTFSEVLVDTPESVIKAVRYGAVDAGIVADIIPGPPLDTTDLRLIAETPPVTLWYVVARFGYSSAVVSAVLDALLAYDGAYRFMVPDPRTRPCGDPD